MRFSQNVTCVAWRSTECDEGASFSSAPPRQKLCEALLTTVACVLCVLGWGVVGWFWGALGWFGWRVGVGFGVGGLLLGLVTGWWWDGRWALWVGWGFRSVGVIDGRMGVLVRDCCVSI